MKNNRKRHTSVTDSCCRCKSQSWRRSSHVMAPGQQESKTITACSICPTCIHPSHQLDKSNQLHGDGCCPCHGILRNRKQRSLSMRCPSKFLLTCSVITLTQTDDKWQSDGYLTGYHSQEAETVTRVVAGTVAEMMG